MANQDSHCMLKAMKKLVELQPKNSIKSITCDRGNEFVHHVNIGIVEATLGVKIYYATPYSPHECDSNEFHIDYCVSTIKSLPTLEKSAKST